MNLTCIKCAETFQGKSHIDPLCATCLVQLRKAKSALIASVLNTTVKL